MSSINVSKEYVNHLIAKSQADSATAAAMQTKLNDKRINRIEKALVTKPVYIPFTFKFNRLGQVSAYSVRSPSYNNDIYIIGAICDNPNRPVSLRRSESQGESFFLSDGLNTRMTTKDIAGFVNPSDTGENGVYYFPNPIVIAENRTMTLDVFKTDDTPVEITELEIMNFVLIGLAVNKRKTVLSDDERVVIERQLAFRDVPEIRLLKQAVTFNTTGIGGESGTIYTPQSEEPLMIRGVKTTLKNSTIEIKVENEGDWMLAPVPVWSVACEEADKNETYRMFERPVYLPPKLQLQIEVYNGIGENYDGTKGNSITFLAETI